MNTAELCKIAVEALEDRKAEDVKVIDIREISPIADYFIIANGTNQNQIQAMRDAADEALYKAGFNRKAGRGKPEFHLDLNGLWRYHHPYFLKRRPSVL